jgi:hypothetical protein
MDDKGKGREDGEAPPYADEGVDEEEAGEPEDTQVVQNDDEQEDGREAVKHMEDSEETGVIDGEETLE